MQLPAFLLTTGNTVYTKETSGFTSVYGVLSLRLSGLSVSVRRAACQLLGSACLEQLPSQ